MNDTLFQLIALGYAVAGLACLGVAAAGTGDLDVTGRVLRAAIGLGSLAYAGYLEFSTTRRIWVFPYLLVLPVVLVVRAAREAAEQRKEAAVTPPVPAPYAGRVNDQPE